MTTITYIIPAGNLVAVKAKLQQGHDDETKNLRGIVGMFTTALSPTGTGNATHFVSSGNMSAEEEAWIEGNLPQSLFTYKGLHAVDGVGEQVSCIRVVRRQHTTSERPCANHCPSRIVKLLRIRQQINPRR